MSLAAFFLKNGYALAAWTESGSLSARVVPAFVCFLIALIPFAYRGVRGKSLPSWKGKLFCGFFLALGGAQAAGFINCASLIAKWFLYQGM